MAALIIHLVSCAFMTGLIWTIQILHYPAFLKIQKELFTTFHQQHSRNITFIVAPMMLIELVTSVFLIKLHSLFVVNLIFLIGIWLCTFFLSIPLHSKLAEARSEIIIAKLVSTNWPRTLLWSIRLILLVAYVIAIFGRQNVGISP
jgi:uncharacterized membrane protein